MLEYYFSKGFVVLECNSNNLKIIANEERKKLSMYRSTISFHENHEPAQGCNPTTTIKITILKNDI